MTQPQVSWREALEAMLHPRVVGMLFLGFSAGIPILLIFSSLSLWLLEAGVERASITFFSWAALGYSFKFVWAPLVDQLPLPLLTRWLGRRRGWLLLSQLAIILSIVSMANTDPQTGSLAIMAIAAVALGFSSATQDIVIDAYRIEAASLRLQSLLSSAYIAGYRVAMVIAGAGALYLAAGFGSTMENYVYSAWQKTYWLIAMTMLLGVLTTLVIAEPETSQQRPYNHRAVTYLRFLGVFVIAVIAFATCFYLSGDVIQSLKTLAADPLLGFLLEVVRLVLAIAVALLVAKSCILLGVVEQQMLDETYKAPVADFFARYGLKTAVLLLLLVGTYRISDIILGVISNVFYADIGFSKEQIALAVKTFGVVMAIVGGFLGGVLSMRFGVLRILFTGALLAALTNLMFLWLAAAPELWLMYLVVAADNLCAGLAGAAFVAFLSGLTNVSFSAMQYAIFSSVMTLLPKLLAGYSGSMVDSLGYNQFFVITTLLGLPVLVLVVLAGKRLIKQDH